jgi:hypothetical protein
VTTTATMQCGTWQVKKWLTNNKILEMAANTLTRYVSNDGTKKIQLALKTSLRSHLVSLLVVRCLMFVV